MHFIKHYKVQILLLILAILKGFAYFYPGYAKGILFAIVEVCLVMYIITTLLTNRSEFIKHHYH